MSTTTSTTNKQVTRLGKRLRKFRKTQGFTQSTVAEYVGVSRGYISNIENGFVTAGSDTEESIKDFISNVESY